MNSLAYQSEKTNGKFRVDLKTLYPHELKHCNRFIIYYLRKNCRGPLPPPLLSEKLGRPRITHRYL